MRRLFIDANIYLGFYNSNASEFKKLLKALVEVSDKIIIPQQIVDEICRNKLNIFRQSIGNYLKESDIKSPFLPEHLDKSDLTKLREWNKKRKEFQGGLQNLNKELEVILKEVFLSIGESSDVVSIELQSVFSKLIQTSKTALEKASMRKLIGNPPGKPGDPLGDQLSWEILLENIKDVAELYIATNDGDYASNFSGSYLLNPILYNDLKRIKPDLKVYVYDKLSIALQEFNKNESIKSLPTEKELQLIIIEEPEVHVRPDIKYYGGGPVIPVKCAYCLAESSFEGIGYMESKSGNFTYRYVCTNCNHMYGGD